MARHAIEQRETSGLYLATGARSKRSSSWDRSGANADWASIAAGETTVLLDTSGPGCVTHLYFVIGFNEITDWRDGILRCFWDGESTPSVEVPRS